MAPCPGSPPYPVAAPTTRVAPRPWRAAASSAPNFWQPAPPAPAAGYTKKNERHSYELRSTHATRVWHYRRQCRRYASHSTSTTAGHSAGVAMLIGQHHKQHAVDPGTRSGHDL